MNACVFVFLMSFFVCILAQYYDSLVELVTNALHSVCIVTADGNVKSRNLRYLGNG